jgi:hypothetical protein
MSGIESKPVAGADAAFFQNANGIGLPFPGLHPGLVCMAPLGRASNGPKRGSVYQPRVQPWGFGFIGFRVLKERWIRWCHLPTAGTDAAFLQNANGMGLPFPGLHPGLICAAPLEQASERLAGAAPLGWASENLAGVAPLGRGDGRWIPD